MIPKGLANAIVVLVSVVWAGNFAASVFVPGYQSDSAINFVFASVVGGAYALRAGDAGTGGGLISRLNSALRPPPPPSPPTSPPLPPEGKP